MPNIPKPELEQGAYIAYANKPGIYLTITIPFFEAEAPVIEPKFSYVG